MSLRDDRRTDEAERAAVLRAVPDAGDGDSADSAAILTERLKSSRWWMAEYERSQRETPRKTFTVPVQFQRALSHGGQAKE